MRICFVCNEYPPAPHGGIGSVVQVLARRLVAAGHAVTVVGVYARSAGAATYEIDDGVEVWRLREPEHRFGWVFARYHLFRWVSAAARAGRVDVVEVPDWEGWAAGWPGLGVPVVARLHGTATCFAADLGEAVRAITGWLERRSLVRADFVCASSEYIARRTVEVLGLGALEPAILHNFVEFDAEPFGAPKRNPNRVLFTGTLTRKKGVLPLIDAWPLVLERHSDAELHLYGKDTPAASSGSMRAILESRLDSRSRSSVHFHGHVPRAQLRQELARARVAVFPSLAEAFGLAPVEAMAAGCPTVSTRRGPGPELAESGRDALLVDPEDPREIADAISRLLGDDALAVSLGAAGRRRVEERFSGDTMVSRNERFFAECVERFHRYR